ncbi:MAG: DUF6544 family protein [Sphaerochaeta sp.]
MPYMKATFKDVDFSLGRQKPTIKIDYVQYNGVAKPQRLAYIDSSLYGIPFEGFDSYLGGTGSRLWRLAKVITLFDQRGEDMDCACLATFLAEALFVPPQLPFSRTYSGKRWMTSMQGQLLRHMASPAVVSLASVKKGKVRWTANLSDYTMQGDLLLPSTLQAVWNYPEGDLLCFDGKDVAIEYVSR